MSCTSKEWSAVARRDGDARQLRVDGRMECTSGGHKLTLEPGNEGIYDDPKVIVLELSVVEPETGTSALTEEVISWSSAIDDEVEVVTVRIDGDDAQRLTITSGD